MLSVSIDRGFRSAERVRCHIWGIIKIAPYLGWFTHPGPACNHTGLEDEEDVEEDFDDPGIMIANDESVAGDDDLTDAANNVFEAWMGETPKFGDYLFEGAKPLVPNKTTDRVTFRELVSNFDTMKYYRVSGSVKYPSITMLARIHFSTMLNAAFQERVFSTCKNVMGNNQAQLDMDHMDMKALLCQNADLIRKKII